MSRIEEKLNRFSTEVMADVGEERRKLMDVLDEELRIEYEQKENDYLTEAYEIIQDALVKIEQKKKESISRIYMGNRTRLFEKRNELLEGIYKKAVDRLIAYKKTEAYVALLVANIEEAKELLGDGEILVKLDFSDQELVSKVSELTGCKVVVESKKVELIGGCIVENKSNDRIVDCAFVRRLEEVKGAFVQYCRLEIE